MTPKPKEGEGTSEAEGPTYPASSFAGIWKYPTGRETPFRSTEDWLAAKRKDDEIEGLWRVYDKLYDLNEFIEQHPGGPHWLELGRGTDITEAFEASHVINIAHVEKTLAKYYRADAVRPRISPYTFKEDGFYKTLKRKIEPVFKKAGTGPTLQLKMFVDSMVILFWIFLISGCYFDSYILKILAGLFCSNSMVCGHNFVHMKTNWRKYYFDLGFLSSYEFTISHTFSHHLYPNTVMDIEVSELEPFYQLFPTHPRNAFQKYGPILLAHVYYPTFFWVGLIKRWSLILLGKQSVRPENLIVFVELLICMLSSNSAVGGLLSWMFIHTSCSFIFLEIGAHAAHHHPDIFHEGDEARTDPDFGLCQMDATWDRREDIFKNLYLVMIIFGDHVLHHLFPTVCHSKLPLIHSIMYETLNEFSEKYPEMPYWELYKGTFKQAQKTEGRKLKSK